MSQLINEAKRFQKLANIKEAEENQSIDPKAATDAEKKAFQIANSSQFDAAMEKEWVKLSDEDRKKLAQSLSSLNEAMGGDFSSFQKIVQKAKDVEGINEDMSDVKTAVGNILGYIGKINALSLFIPGALAIAKAAGLGAFMGATPAFLGSLTASMILWWLGKKIADSGNGADEFLDEIVNKSLRKLRENEEKTSSDLTPEQVAAVNDIFSISEGDENLDDDAKFKKLVSKIQKYASKGILTAALVATLISMASCSGTKGMTNCNYIKAKMSGYRE